MIRRPPRSTPLSLHDALPICVNLAERHAKANAAARGDDLVGRIVDRKSTRLNSSHLVISYAVFCLKKKRNRKILTMPARITHHSHSSVSDRPPPLSRMRRLR